VLPTNSLGELSNDACHWDCNAYPTFPTWLSLEPIPARRPTQYRIAPYSRTWRADFFDIFPSSGPCGRFRKPGPNLAIESPGSVVDRM
jgi:hypothetical protein